MYCTFAYKNFKGIFPLLRIYISFDTFRIVFHKKKINKIKHVLFLPDAYPGHSGESFCSSDLSLDGTDGGFDIGENDGGGADGSHQGASHSHHGSSSHDTPSLSQSLHAAIHNPIDKLFMMQSSYFSGDHA